jgi:hypothetical protein
MPRRFSRDCSNAARSRSTCQVLYNTHFSGDMLWWLELVHTHTIDTPRATAWSDPEWMMFDMGAYGSGARFVLETAVKHAQSGAGGMGPRAWRQPRLASRPRYALPSLLAV